MTAVKKNFCLSVLVLLIASGISFAGSREVNKAVGFRKGGMHKQAVAILEKEINESPTNAEAHFQLGLIYAMQGNMGAADERFASATGLKPDEYGLLIGSELKKLGSERLKVGQRDRAQTLFDMAIQYQPSLRGKICAENFQLGNQAHDMVCANYYLVAGRFCADYNQQIGQRLIRIANSQTTVEARDLYLNHAKRFIPLEQIEPVPEPSAGWRVQGTDLIADLQPGQEEKRLFKLDGGKSTPQLVLPQNNYKIRVDHLQPIIIEVDGKKTLVRPEDIFRPEKTSGDKRYKFTALEGGADVAVTISRSNK